jgi:NTP pyrophosphatase (non-canonical NTP hydrolase)
MQQISDWNILRDQAHEMAKRHGFWDESPSDNHFLCLIVSELMEAVEADRKDRHGNLKEMVEIVDNQEKSEYGITDHWLDFWFKTYFEEKVKDSVGDELADAVIRILDLAGRHNINMEGIITTQDIVSRKKSFTENIYSIVKDLVNYRYSLDEQLNYARLEICRLAQILEIDIVKHINLKMMYNKMRIKLHGKKY